MRLLIENKLVLKQNLLILKKINEFMNSSEIQLIDSFIEKDNAKMSLAMTKLFFAPKGQVMGRYQKAAFDAIQRKFNGDRYASVSVREKYETAMSVVYPKLIEILRKEKASFVEQNRAVIDSIIPSTHWTCNYGNFAGWLSTVIEREANRNRSRIDALLGLKPEIIGETNYDDGRKVPSSESDGVDDLELDGTENPDAPIGAFETIMEGNQSEFRESEDNPEADYDTETEGEILQDEFVSDSSDETESSEQKILIVALYDAISNLKSERDKDIILTIMIGGMSEENYARLHNLDINGLYRDVARAKARLIVNMVPYIQQKNKSLVRKYMYLLDEKSASLVYDIIVRGISFSDAAISRNCRVSDIQTKFSAAYKKMIKEHNSVISEEIGRIIKEDKKLKKAYAKYKASLANCGAE